MAKVINEWDHIKKQKLKNGLLFCGLSGVVFIGFIFNNLLPVQYYFMILFFNILVILITAYFGVKLIIYIPFKISSIENSGLLEQLSDDFYIMNGIILNNEKHRSYFEHIIIGPNKTYFIHLKGNDSKKVKNYNEVIEEIIDKRGLRTSFEIIFDQDQLTKLIKTLEINDQGQETIDQKRIVDCFKRIAI